MNGRLRAGRVCLHERALVRNNEFGILINAQALSQRENFGLLGFLWRTAPEHRQTACKVIRAEMLHFLHCFDLAALPFI